LTLAVGFHSPRRRSLVWIGSLAWAHPGPYDVRMHPGRAVLCSDPFDLRPQGSFGSCLGGDPRLAAPPARQDCDSCGDHGQEDHSNGHHGDRHGLWCEAGLSGGTHICRQAAFVPGARTVRATRMRSTASARRRAMSAPAFRGDDVYLEEMSRGRVDPGVGVGALDGRDSSCCSCASPSPVLRSVLWRLRSRDVGSRLIRGHYRFPLRRPARTTPAGGTLRA
jgi:hypothetical protein